MLPGTSKDTKHCVALRVAQNWMQSSPVYVISHVMMAETILQRLTGNELPLDFYKRRAQLYAAVRDIMSSASTAGLVVFAVIQLIWVEFVLKLPHLQVMHVNALNTLIDANGGLAKYLSKTKDGPVLEPRFYVGMHILTEAHIANDMLLKKMRDQFISNLGRIQRWFLCVQHFSQNLQSLTIFLTEPINIDLLDSPFHKAVSCFFCCYNTCMAFIEYECDTGRALEYLIQVQKTLPMSGYTCLNGGSSLAHLFADARLEMPWHSDEVEMRIYEASAAAMRVFPLMSGPSKLKMTQMLSKIALLQAWHYGYDVGFMGRVSTEITQEWHRRHGRNISPGPGSIEPGSRRLYTDK